jgi:mono/diheme cytochrome c family protein
MPKGTLMSSPNHRPPRPGWVVRLVAGLGLLALLPGGPGTAQKPADAQAEYAAVVQPLLKKYCLGCHSTELKKGSLDLERFTSLGEVRKDVKRWQQVLEMLEAGEMPPKKKQQPTAEERQRLVAWTRGFLDAEARARAGDPGYVPLRRLSNTEYDCTVRDLTGVDLRPTREFPADGAAGEGFTNAAEALSDISPTLLNKYLNAAKDIADHAVLLPDGFRFSPAKTRRDWTDESTARLRQFYPAHTAGDGRLPVQPYLAAAVRHRDALLAGKVAPADVAVKENLNRNYFGVLWQTLTDGTPSYPLDVIRARWRTATEKDVAALAGEVAAWQAALWKTTRIGSYIRPEGKGYAVNMARQVPADPPTAESVALRLALKPVPGQTDVTLYLVARELPSAGSGGHIVWHRPRFEAAGKPPLLLRDYAEFGPSFEVDYPALFAGSAKYLAAAVEAANDRNVSPDDLAKKHGLDTAFLKRWVEVVAVELLRKGEDAKWAPAVALELLEEKTPKDGNRPAVNGWRKKGTDLPVLVTNASDKEEHIPGRVSAHGVAVHPMPKEFVAVAWKSPVAGTFRVSVRVAHAHPACGNGVAWWLEQRRAGRATPLGEGAIDLGQEARPPATTLKIEKGDVVVLAVDARDGNHFCDMTEIGFTLTEADKPGRVWDLAADVADTVLAGNPHADRHGNADAWSFVRGASKGGVTAALIPPDSVLGRWRQAAADPARQDEAGKLAGQVEALLTGPRPAKEKDPDRVLYDKLVATDSPLFAGVDVARLAKPRPKGTPYGLAKERFGPGPDAGLVVAADTVTEVRLPAALFAGREFVVDGRLDSAPGDRVVGFRVLTAAPRPDRRDEPGGSLGPVLASPDGAGYKRLLQGYADFRRLFPLFLCFPNVVPTDEVVSLKMFHREDEPLARLFLDAEQQRRLDRLWAEHRFISRQPVAENNYLPQFIGFVTQDQPKEMVAFFEGQRPAFQKRADEFLKEEEAAIPRQLDALLEFAGRAYRRPLREKEKTDLLGLYRTIRGKGAGHEEAFRGVLARVLVSPAFLFRIEQPPAGKEPAAVSDWELATRLSYFLWSSIPDDELRTLAAAGRLHEPKVLAGQVQRMLKDERLRALAVEFGTQWIHVRGFDEFKEKNEKLFPTFDAALRKAMYDEAILFFQDLFQSDRGVTAILDADYTFLNEALAKHYGIPGVTGPQWRRVDGVRKFGRGGVLGLASVQARQAGASRTSPVLRGNWVSETLLGEKLPRPPANVPRLPEEEGDGGLTMRQQVERHAKDATCAACHVRIDPFGFALEKYDAIGRLRAKDLGGLALDTRARLRDGTEFDGLDGLRSYLLTKKRDVVVRLFCRRLLGYALGRSVTLSDQALLDEMIAELDRNEGKISSAVQVIVRSPQFRMIRGSEYPE